MTVRTPGERAARGERAKRELEMTGEAFEAVARALFEEWLNTGPGDVQTREQIYFTAVGLARAKRDLQATVSDGKLAQHELDMEKVTNAGS